MMFDFGSYNYINLDHVESVQLRWSKDSKLSAELTFADGRRKTMAVHSDVSHTIGAATIIPAPEGFKLAILVEESKDGPFDLVEEPIIAFRIPHSGDIPMPMTIDGEATNRWNKWAIIRPDGSVCDPYVADYKDTAAYLDDWQRWREEKKG